MNTLIIPGEIEYLMGTSELLKHSNGKIRKSTENSNKKKNCKKAGKIAISGTGPIPGCPGFHIRRAFFSFLSLHTLTSLHLSKTSEGVAQLERKSERECKKKDFRRPFVPTGEPLCIDIDEEFVIKNMGK